MAGREYSEFQEAVQTRLLGHPVVTDNAYTAWFAQGDVSLEQLRHFTVQFSVFSNLFLLAALNRVINADSLAAAHEAKEILMNELGVVYTPERGVQGRTMAVGTNTADDAASDAELMSVEGTVEGGRFHFRAAHFEWLIRFAQPLGLTFRDLGKRHHGTPTTLRFCDELFRLYGSDDYNEAMGAAFAVENWAAAGFWRQLIAGLERVKSTAVPQLPLSFFTWHAAIEDQHKAHVWDELEACFASPEFDPGPFLSAGVTMLDGVKVFWDGLDADRRQPGGALPASRAS